MWQCNAATWLSALQRATSQSIHYSIQMGRILNVFVGESGVLQTVQHLNVDPTTFCNLASQQVLTLLQLLSVCMWLSCLYIQEEKVL